MHIRHTTLFATAALGLSSAPAICQSVAITPHCVSALRDQALAQAVVTPVNPRVIRPLGIPGDQPYATRQYGFVDNDAARNVFAAGPENPPRLILIWQSARPPIGLSTARFWRIDRDGNLIAAISVANSQIQALDVTDPAVRTTFNAQWSRFVVWARTRGVCV